MQIINKIIDWITTPYTIYLILRDPTISDSVKMRAVAALIIMFAYIISPIDLVPEFIPFAGWLDDIIVVPVIVALVRKITPEIDVVEKRHRAQASVRRTVFRVILAIVITLLMILLFLGLLIYLMVRLIMG